MGQTPRRNISGKTADANINIHFVRQQPKASRKPALRGNLPGAIDFLLLILRKLEGETDEKEERQAYSGWYTRQSSIFVPRLSEPDQDWESNPTEGAT